MIEIFSPAKINLFLGVMGKRGDGFHEVLSLVAQVGLADRMWMELVEGEDEVESDCIGLPLGMENMVMKAIKAFRRRYAFGNGVRIKLDKRIPMGAGLGGGSSNAVTTLSGVNRLLGGVLGEGELREIGIELGSDCALFFERGACIVRGRGEVIEAVGKEFWERLSGQRVLIFKPKYSVNTGWAYGQMERRPDFYIERGDAELILKERMSRFLVDGGLGGIFYNNFEKVVFEEHEELGELMRRLRRVKVSGLLSGSGSACFCVLGEGSDVLGIRSIIKEVLGEDVFIVETTIY